ncbi:hypothetical protein GmHk_02G004924 [Glycine max]|nr:hypothetical protein GmHk_02G004924 [Glycine max]
MIKSSIQCPWRVGLHHIDETVSIDSKIISIVSWPDYTSEEEKVNKDYKIINEFTRNEYTDLYPVYDKYNHYGKIFDYLGYNLMFKTELKIVNMKYNSTQDLITKNETRLNQIQKKVDFFYENFEKNRNSTSISTKEQTSGLMALQNKGCIPITEVVLQALVDTGCSFTSICKSVVPQHNCFRSNIITKTRTMSGDIITNDTEPRNFTIQLSTNCDIFVKKIFINKVDIVDLQPAKEQMILGLYFITHDNRSITIIKYYLLISTNSQMSPMIDELTSELRTKRGDTPTNPISTLNSQCPCDIPGSCKIKESQKYCSIYWEIPKSHIGCLNP